MNVRFSGTGSGLCGKLPSGSQKNFLIFLLDTPLHWAVHRNNIEVVRLLLVHDADPNIHENNRGCNLY